MIEFKEFPKISRLNRGVIITEKLDGTNACVIVCEDGTVAAQSRSKLITTDDDNYGFAAWVQKNADDLRTLGPGHHFGEWWGCGIQRGYGLTEKRFSLFNSHRWETDRPACCGVVPVLSRWTGFERVAETMDSLRVGGSVAAPGFMRPEGIVVFHTHGQVMFKATIEKDSEWKGKK